ncbi:MAG: Ig domain protein group 1 domain protein [Bryobacterales bacterium]|nr:Ig domain protein group 1 domain protein [Bryobacterales bacterium]
MKSKVWVLAAAAVLVATLWATPARADYQVFVGYADDLRATPFFPNPFDGTNGTTAADFFVGSGPSRDAGAIMIVNSGSTNLTINDLLMIQHPFSQNIPFQIWGGGLPITLTAGQTAVFTQTSQFNFDTSDQVIVAADLSNNCSVGPVSTTDICTKNAPLVDVTVNGALTEFKDTGHVLDTGGFDANCCLFNGNESLQWRLIGTTGIENPGGTVPEPSSVFLLGSGLIASFTLLRRKMRKQA